MGMAASQARLLSITARMSNNEFEQQAVAYSKQRLADKSEQINDEYLDALAKTKYQLLTGYNGTEACYADVTYNQLTGLNSVAAGKQYIVKDKSGKILVSSQLADNFKKSNGDFNKFLSLFGLTQADIDPELDAVTEDQIHQAWDKYLVSVGKSIDSADSEHILGFNYVSFSNEAFNGYPVYNSAFATSIDGRYTKNLYKDGGGYYTLRSTVVAKEYTDSEGNTQVGAFYQTGAQQGTNEYTQLEDVICVPNEDKTSYTFTYINKDGKKVEGATTLYVSESMYGIVGLSENQKDYLKSYTNDGYNYYKDEIGNIYTVTDTPKALNYDGATQEQRDLYDYALALTAAYYDKDSFESLKYDAQQIKYYQNIFNQMRTFGYTTTKDESKFKEADWLVNQLKSGAFIISYYSATEKNFISTTLDDDESIVEKEDKSAIALAEQEYNAAMDRIENQDKMFDLQLSRLESEHTALSTEYDAIKDLVKKNIDKSYNIFNA